MFLHRIGRYTIILVLVGKEGGLEVKVEKIFTSEDFPDL
jgi:hypothetical protein